MPSLTSTVRFNPSPSFSRHSTYADTLLLMTKSPRNIFHSVIPLTGMSKRCVSQIMSKCDCLRQIFIQTKCFLQPFSHSATLLKYASFVCGNGLLPVQETPAFSPLTAETIWNEESGHGLFDKPDAGHIALRMYRAP